MENKKRYCKYCGNEVQEGLQYCDSCGKDREGNIAELDSYIIA